MKTDDQAWISKTAVVHEKKVRMKQKKKRKEKKTTNKEAKELWRETARGDTTFGRGKKEGGRG